MKTKMTREQHLEAIKVVHGDRYEYGAFDIESGLLEIKCKIHGWFLMDVHSHKKGCNCPPCAVSDGYKKRHENTLNRFRGRLPEGLELLSYNRETRIASFKCKKHGLFNRRMSELTTVKNLCAGCRKERRLLKSNFINDYPTAEVVTKLKSYLSKEPESAFYAAELLLKKRTYTGDYLIGDEIFTLDKIKEIYNATSLF